MEIVCCHTRDCCDKPGYKRTIYCVEVAPQLFDVIFNSQSGYRGAYFQSPERGLSANGLVLSTVTPRLVAWTRDRCIHQGPAFAEKSLSAASANYGSRKSHFHSVIGARANGPLQCEQMSRSLMGDGSAIFTHTRNGVARHHGSGRFASLRDCSLTRTTNMLPLTRRAGPPTFGPVDGHDKRFPSPRCASTIRIVRPWESTAETQPQLQLALPPGVRRQPLGTQNGICGVLLDMTIL